MKPDLPSFALRQYNELEPLTFAEEQLDWPLAKFIYALGLPYQEIEDLVRDQNGYPGWSALLDVDRCPSKALGYLGQFVGVRLPTWLSDTDRRDRIRRTDGWRRGGIDALAAAAQPHLTGTKSVLIAERSSSAYTISVLTYTEETPDENAVYAAMLEQKAGGIIIDYNTVAGWTYQDIYENFATYQELFAEYTTYQGVFQNDPGN